MSRILRNPASNGAVTDYHKRMFNWTAADHLPKKMNSRNFQSNLLTFFSQRRRAISPANTFHLGGLLVCGLLILLSTASAAIAANFTVTNINDSGPGSLRQSIIDSNTNDQEDTINFDAAVFSVHRTIVLSSGMLTIRWDGEVSGFSRLLTINGPGANLLTIDANNVSRVISLEQRVRTVISGVKVTGGIGIGGGEWVNAGAGILVKGGYAGEGVSNLILKSSIIAGNQAESNGGGMLLGGTSTIIGCLITENSAGIGGGGIGTTSNAKVYVLNTTISKNRSTYNGAGILNFQADVHLVNSTIAFNYGINETTGGGGVYQLQDIFYDANFYARNSIFSNNIIGATLQGDVMGDFNSLGHNIVGKTYDYINITGDTTGNQLNADPLLNPDLRLNGGVIPVHSLGEGSPAIDRGNNCVTAAPASGGCLEPIIAVDQRGAARPQDGDGDGTATVDIGAFETIVGEIQTTPAPPDLSSSSDSGQSATDNITSARNLTFSVSGVDIGAAVEFFRDAILIDSKIAQGTDISFTDNGLPADGRFSYSVRQIANGLTSLHSSALVVTVDNTGPNVSINQQASQSDPTRIQPIGFRAVFSEPVFGFEPPDVVLSGTANVSGGTVELSGSGTTYTLSVSNISSDGAIAASIPSGVAADTAGNTNAASTSTDNTVMLDTASPTVTVNQAAAQLDPVRTLPVNFTVIFSEPVTGFTNADVSLAGSTINAASASKTVTGSGTTYNVAVSSFSSAGGTIVVSIPAAAAQDTAGNLNTASASTDNAVTVDNVIPTVTINQAAGQSDPTNVLPVNFTVVFSEPVTGFDASDVQLSGSFGFNTFAAVVMVSGTGSAYNVAVSNITTNGGSLRAGIRSAAAADSLGNNSSASASTDNTVSIDNVGPTLSINQGIGQSDPASIQPVTFTVVFNDLVTGFDSGDISLAGSTANVSNAVIQVTGSGSVYHVTVRNIVSSGTVRLNVAAGAALDATGNASTAITINDNTVSITAAADFDYDGDGRSDISVRSPSNSIWSLLFGTADTPIQFGSSGDHMAPADYDGDGKTDIAVFRPSNGTWYFFNSASQTFTEFRWGQDGDLPAPADHDGDGKADLVVFRPSTGTWYAKRSSDNSLSATIFGAAGDKPVIGDFDGDSKDDIGVFRASDNNWYLLKSTEGFWIHTWGASGDVPVSADYDGDGETDIAVFRPSTGEWYRILSATGFNAGTWGQDGDIPVAADYDGDGKADIAVFRPTSRTWYLVGTSTGISVQPFGQNGDVPTQAAYRY